MNSTPEPTLRELFSVLAELTRYAATSGMPAERLAADSDRLQAALEELGARRADAQDPRRAKALPLAYSVLRARIAGASIEQCRERFGKSPSQIYRLIAFARHHATHMRSNDLTDNDD